jgi:hypothetical protein
VYQVKQAELQLQSDIFETELSISKKEIELEEALGASPLDSQRIVSADAALEGEKAGLKKLLEYQKILFPESKKK